MIIELCGLPGTGKTTLSRSFIDQVGYSRIEFSSKKEIIKFFLIAVLSYPFSMFYFFWVALINDSRPTSLWNNYVVRLSKYIKASSLKEGFYVIDESLHQNLYSYPSYFSASNKIQAYLNKLPFVPDVVIVLNASSEIRRERIRQRSLRPNRKEVQRRDVDELLMNGVNILFLEYIKSNPRYLVFDTQAGSYDLILKKYAKENH